MQPHHPLGVFEREIAFRRGVDRSLSGRRQIEWPIDLRQGEGGWPFSLRQELEEGAAAFNVAGLCLATIDLTISLASAETTCCSSATMRVAAPFLRPAGLPLWPFRNVTLRPVC